MKQARRTASTWPGGSISTEDKAQLAICGLAGEYWKDNELLHAITPVCVLVAKAEQNRESHSPASRTPAPDQRTDARNQPEDWLVLPIDDGFEDELSGIFLSEDNAQSNFRGP